MDLIEKKDNLVNRHPWELSRFDSLYKEIKKYYKEGDFLDIGCGDSFFDLKLLETDLNINKMIGIDIFLDKCKSGKRYSTLNSYEKLKGKKFDTILMFDVLEHIEDDDKFIKDNLSKLIKDNSRIIMTIPAHQYLYSKHDEDLKHFRRYNKKMIRELCKNNHFKIVNYHYFYFSLYLYRLIFRNSNNEINDWKNSEKSFKTKLYRFILNTDYKLCKLFGKISNGLSLFVVIEKEK